MASGILECMHEQTKLKLYLSGSRAEDFVQMISGVKCGLSASATIR